VASGGTKQFNVTVTPGSCDQRVIWSTTVSGATISTAGLFQAPSGLDQNRFGNVKVARVVNPNNFKTASVTVLARTLSSIAVTPSTVPALLVGNTQQLTATGTYNDNTTKDITSTSTWATTNSSAATVSAGLVSGVAAGSANITASLSSITSNSVPVTVPNPVAAIPASFFAMDINANSSSDPWPGVSPATGVSFGTYRTLGSSIKWADIEPTCEGGTDPNNSCYHWTNFDKWTETLAETNGQAVMFTAYATPSWASSRGINCPNGPGCTGPPDTSCAFQSQNGPGICDPPNDLSTGDTHWQNFLTALIAHMGSGELKYLEVWNEPNVSSEWNGTATQLVQMEQDAYNVRNAHDSTIQIISPAVTATPVTSGCSSIANYFANQLLPAGAATYADVIGFHGYVSLPSNTASDTSCVGNVISTVQTALANAGVSSSKQIYDTEASWGTDGANGNNNTNIRAYPAQERSFVGITYLVQATNSVCASGSCNTMAGFSWYGWDFNNTGEFWDPTAVALIPAGVAYTNVYRWLVGASPSTSAGSPSPCSVNGTVWTCNLTRPGNYYAQAVWDCSQTCTTTCNHSSYTYPSNMTYSLDLSGDAAVQLSGGTVNIGLEPILLESSNSLP
jgi:hypothetical protein